MVGVVDVDGGEGISDEELSTFFDKMDKDKNQNIGKQEMMQFLKNEAAKPFKKRIKSALL